MTKQTRRAPCPQCNRGPKDDALAVTTDERGTVEYCHRCGYTAASNSDSSVGNAAADRTVRGKAPELSSCRGGRDARPPNDKADPARLKAIWQRTVPLKDTVGEVYLRHRHCVIPPADSHVRFLPGNDTYPPSLCSLVTHAVTAEPLTLHFTRLRADGLGKAGSGRDKLLLGGFPKKGGVIRLWPDEAVSDGLAIAEGIETALCAAHGYTPIWATVDGGNMASLPVLPGIEALVVFADHDEAGLKAARQCGRRWVDAGVTVQVVAPETGDVADALEAA